MGQFRDVVGWLVAVILTGCVASQPGGTTGLRAAPDVLLSAGDIQVAQEYLRSLGFDPGPVVGVFTPETQGAVRAYQARYGLPVSGLLDRETRRALRIRMYTKYDRLAVSPTARSHPIYAPVATG